MSKKCCKKGSDENRKIEKLSEFLKVVSEENRLRIICLLKQGEKCVCEIYEHLELAQNLTSHHLKVLSDAKIVNSRQDGLNVFYSLNAEKVDKYEKIISQFL